MEDELEVLWKKLSFTKEDGESISLGSSTTEAAKLVGKNCIVMRVLSHKCMNIEALRKNLTMLWKPNKGVEARTESYKRDKAKASSARQNDTREEQSKLKS